jgi:hypothetical protein
MLISRAGRESSNEVEETIPPGGDVCTMLNVVRGPVSLGRFEVTLIEQNVESFE